MACRINHPARLTTVLLVIAALALAGCGTKTVTSTGSNGQVTTQTVKNVHFSNTKFLLHMGLAFGAFHRYIYKPLRDGALRSGAPGRIRVLLKGAAAAAFVVHELRLAHEDALSSDQLRPLANKLDSLTARISGLIAGLKNGSASPAAISGASSATNALGATSSGLGFHISDIAHAL
jgi:hypothetical protein